MVMNENRTNRLLLIVKMYNFKFTCSSHSQENICLNQQKRSPSAFWILCVTDNSFLKKKLFILSQFNSLNDNAV